MCPANRSAHATFDCSSNFGLNNENAYRPLAVAGASRYDDKMKAFGKFLQVIGLTALPLAIVLELTKALGRSSGVSDMLVMMVFGFAVFYAGRFVEGYARH